MSELGSQDAEIPKRSKPEAPFCWQGNEVYDVFLPIMGPDAFAVYAYFTRREFIDRALKHTVRTLADATGLGRTTVSRVLEILERLRLVKLRRFGGSRESECTLLDTKVAAKRLGAKYNSQTVSYFVPSEVSGRLMAEISQLKKRQQGKPSENDAAKASCACGKSKFAVSQRDAGASPEGHQHVARETQTGSHLLLEERRNEEAPTPTPTPSESGDAQQDKDSPDEDEPDRLLKLARAIFTGPMNDLRAYLLDTSRPPNPRLTNGFADWRDFCFDSLAVERAQLHGETLELVLRASNPEAAGRGLEKYQRRWRASLREWYKCEVEMVLVKAQR